EDAGRAALDNAANGGRDAAAGVRGPERVPAGPEGDNDAGPGNIDPGECCRRGTHGAFSTEAAEQAAFATADGDRQPARPPSGSSRGSARVRARASLAHPESGAERLSGLCTRCGASGALPDG